MKTFVIVSALVRYQDKFLVLKRSMKKDFAPGEWEPVSGFVDTRESAEEIILRELQEETGLTGRILGSGGSSVYEDKEGRWVIVPFLVEVESDQVKLNHSDHIDFKWETASDLKNYPDLQAFLENGDLRVWLRI